MKKQFSHLVTMRIANSKVKNKGRESIVPNQKQGVQQPAKYGGSYLPSCKTNFVIVLLAQTILFSHFINTTAYLLGRWEPSSPSTKGLHAKMQHTHTHTSAKVQNQFSCKPALHPTSFIPTHSLSLCYSFDYSLSLSLLHIHSMSHTYTHTHWHVSMSANRQKALARIDASLYFRQFEVGRLRKCRSPELRTSETLIVCFSLWTLYFLKTLNWINKEC